MRACLSVSQWLCLLSLLSLLCPLLSLRTPFLLSRRPLSARLAATGAAADSGEMSVETSAASSHEAVAAEYAHCVVPSYSRLPLTAVAGKGSRILALTQADPSSPSKENKKWFLDFCAGIATCSLGHAHPVLVEAISRQAQSLMHCSNLMFTPQQAKLAHWLSAHSLQGHKEDIAAITTKKEEEEEKGRNEGKHSPVSFKSLSPDLCDDFSLSWLSREFAADETAEDKRASLNKVFFCNSGAEANEAALKLARKYAHVRLNISTPIIITAHNSFHGRTLATITATGQPKYQSDLSPLPAGFNYVHFNDANELRAFVENIQEKRKNNSGCGEGVAAVLIESIQGEGGVTPASYEFFKTIRDVCDKSGALMMVDEVQTGVGRTGSLWGYQQLSKQARLVAQNDAKSAKSANVCEYGGAVVPDVISSAKGLGGGMPIGAMICKNKFSVFGPGDHASTFGGNPLACAAATAVTQYLEKSNVMENVEERGNQLRGKALEIQKRFPNIIKDVRGWGLMCGVELSSSVSATAGDVCKSLMEEGLLLVPAGPKVVRFVPALTVSAEEVDEAMHKFGEAIEKLASSNNKI